MVLKSLARFCAASIIAVTGAANADVIGYYLSATTGSPATAITNAGHTAQQLTGLSAADLVGIDVLWILNGANGAPDAEVTGNVAAVQAFVQSGHVLSFHDRNVDQGLDASTYIPGAGGVDFVQSFGTNIDVVTANAVTAGINNTTLDGGNFSNHGYATLASLPVGAVPVLSNGNASQIVDFYFGLGAGYVYYSTIPLDFYLAGGGSVPAFAGTYAPQEAGFQASLSVAQVPEPGIFALMGIALLSFGITGRRRRTKAE